MSKKQVQLYLVGKKLLASVNVLHKWGTMQSGPMFPFQYQIRMFGKKLSLFFKPELPPAVLVLLHFFHTSLVLFLCCLFFKQWPTELLKWSLFLGSLSSCSVRWCSFCVPLQVSVPKIPGVFRPPVESWERCPSYTSCIWKQVSSSSTSRSRPGNGDGFSCILWTIL